MSSLQATCPVCCLHSATTRLYGASVCRACGTFFYRYVKDNKRFDCKNDAKACGLDALKNVTAKHACKKCRIQRCFDAGMVAKCVNIKPKVDIIIRVDAERFPLLAQAASAIARATSYRNRTDCSMLYGTSELGSKFLTGKICRDEFVENALCFRRMFDYFPVVSGLDVTVKEQFFKNGYAHSISLRRTHLLVAPNKEKFFVHPNKYLNLEEKKLCQFVHTHKDNKTALCRSHDCDFIARMLLDYLLRARNTLSNLVLDLVSSEEEYAAFMLLIVLQSTNLNQGHVQALSAVWKELDDFYGLTMRDRYLWGNCVLFLSNLQTVVGDFLEVTRMFDLFIRKSSYVMIVDREHP